MKKIIIVLSIVFCFSVTAQAYGGTFEKTDFYFFGINTKGIKELTWWKFGLGAVASVAVHTGAHYAYSGLAGMSISQQGLIEVSNNHYEAKKERERAQIGLAAQNIVGIILTSIPATRQTDFTKGYVAAALAETVFYPAIWKDNGDLNVSSRNGGNADIEYWANTIVATHNFFRIKWYKD
jgi:hypothetical protein